MTLYGEVSVYHVATQEHSVSTVGSSVNDLWGIQSDDPRPSYFAFLLPCGSSWGAVQWRREGQVQEQDEEAQDRYVDEEWLNRRCDQEAEDAEEGNAREKELEERHRAVGQEVTEE